MVEYRVFFYNATDHIPTLWDDSPYTTASYIVRNFESLDEAAAFAKEVMKIGCDFAIFRMSGEEQDG